MTEFTDFEVVSGPGVSNSGSPVSETPRGARSFMFECSISGRPGLSSICRLHKTVGESGAILCLSNVYVKSLFQMTFISLIVRLKTTQAP